MDSPPPPDTAEALTVTPAPDSTASSPPPPTNESSTLPPSGDSSSPPPSENSSPPPPKEKTSTPPPSASPPPASPPPTQESSPPPSGESPPPKDSSQSPPPSENASPSPPSGNEPKAPTPHSSSDNNNNNNNTSPSIFSPPSHSSGSSQMPPPSKLSPSPPPPRKASPSSDGGSSSSSNDSNSSESSPNVAIVAGIAVAGVLLLALIILVVMCSKKKKRKPYYMDHGRGPPPGGDYYHGKAGNPWHSPQPTDHVVKLPPPPGTMGTPVGGGGGWGGPPPPGNASGEYSSGLSSQAHVPLPPPSPHVGGNMGLGFSKSQFSYEELAAATSGFTQANLLGQGGFGYVHKGVLPNGQVVAVKSLKSGSGQGEREFQAEVEIISRVHHRHLVSLVGYCIADGQRMLVYEFVPNSTLEFHLHGKGRPVMDFTSRMRIAMGSAKGLAYLHEDCHPRIIHRDIKAANILLDDNYEAMVADFGLAKLSSDNFTHVSTRVMGTFGYLAPEYASSGKLSEKSDVFSFGVMLLELITGRRPVDPTSKYMEDSLVDWARPLLQKAIEDGDYGELADPRLEGNFPPNEMSRLVTCAAASVRHSARRRPKMSQIVRALEGGDASLDDLNENGVKPGQSSTYSSNQSADRSYDTCAYNADMMKFRKMVMDDSQDFNSSQYGATSEYGLNPSSSSSESGNSGPHKQKL